MNTEIAGGGRRILVADDSAVQRLVLARRLERLGFVVIPAANGDEALARVEAEPPDAVVTDLQMEPTDGLELCRRLKADRRFARIPVIVTSVSDPDATNAALTRAAGGDDYAVRTADLEAVLAALARAVK